MHRRHPHSFTQEARACPERTSLPSPTPRSKPKSTDENRATAARYNVRYLPTLALFRDGKLVAQITGAAPEPKIRELLNAK